MRNVMRNAMTAWTLVHNSAPSHSFTLAHDLCGAAQAQDDNKGAFRQRTERRLSPCAAQPRASGKPRQPARVGWTPAQECGDRDRDPGGGTRPVSGAPCRGLALWTKRLDGLLRSTSHFSQPGHPQDASEDAGYRQHPGSSRTAPVARPAASGRKIYLDAGTDLAAARLWLLFLAALCALAPELAFAGSPFATGASATQQQLTSILTPIAAVAVMVSGAMAWFGRLSWWWMVAVVIGTVLVFGGPQIVSWIRGLFGV